ncbi:MAG TPA: Rdx family protein [Anaerolineaceae bacterium]|nr:Rdx family protein [Anaerolineaceae bacterium]
MIKKVSIEYCVPCQYEREAKNLAGIIQDQFGLAAESIELIPSKKIGTFEVQVDDVPLYSKSKSGALPTPEEIIRLIFMQPRG